MVSRHTPEGGSCGGTERKAERSHRVDSCGVQTFALSGLVPQVRPCRHQEQERVRRETGGRRRRGEGGETARINFRSGGVIGRRSRTQQRRKVSRQKRSPEP